MSKKIAFRVVLTNATADFKVYTIVTAYDEDTALDIALSHYEGLEVYDVDLA